MVATEFLHAQPYYFKHYQVENGLSNNTIFCSIQDSNGFMWFGTKDGLNKFDGYTFKTYRNIPGRSGSLGNDLIYCLHNDPSSVLWVGTDDGIYSFDPMHDSFHLLQGTRGMNIHSIVSDGKGALWFVAAGRLYKYEHDTINSFGTKVNFDANVLYKSHDGTLWICTNRGTIERYDPALNDFETFRVMDDKCSGADGTVSGIEETVNHQMLIGTTTQGIRLFDPSTGISKNIIRYNKDRTRIFVRDLVKLNINEFWIGTESGIYIYNHQTGKVNNLKKQFNNGYSLSDNAVYSVCRDKEGGIWSGTYFGGINYYAPQYSAFTKYFPQQQEHSISGSAVREITSDRNGKIWVGTEDAGLNHLDPKTGLFTSYLPDGSRKAISYSNIHGLLADGSWIWVATFEHGIDILDINTGKIIKHFSPDGKNGLRSNFILSFYRSASGTIFLATTNGMYTFNKRKEFFEPVKGLPFVFFNSIMEDNEHNFWAGTFDAGVYKFRLDGTPYQHFLPKKGNPSSLSHHTVNSIYQDSGKNLWITTDGGGLCLYDPKTSSFIRFGIHDGFPSNYLFRMEEDDEHQLWISSTRGLIRFDPLKRRVKIYSKSDGLLTDQFNYSSSFKDQSGRMYFGSVKGMISFVPRQLRHEYKTPPVFLTSFQINNDESMERHDDYTLGKNLLSSDTIVLENSQSSFSLSFASLSYISPEMTQYAYKMKGLYKDWVYLKSNRRIYFTKLSPGDYIFEAKALMNGSDAWSGSNVKLFIRILPPIWLSPVAYLVYILSAILLIWALVLRYHRKIARKNRRRMEVFEHEKEKEIYQAKIEFFTHVSHEIRTPLTLIQGPMEKLMGQAHEMPSMEKNLRIMNRNTDRLLELTNQLLDFRKTEKNSFSLSFIKSDISELLEEITQDFLSIAEQKEISIELHTPALPLSAYVDPEALHKIIGSLLDNAIKYSDSSIVIDLEYAADSDDFFKISVSSDGVIIPTYLHQKVFEPFYRIKETEIRPGTGIGLSISRSLAELHQGNLVLEQKRHGYNTFTVTLPIHQLIEFNLNAKWKKH